MMNLDQLLSPSRFIYGWSQSETDKYEDYKNLSFEPEYLAILQDIFPGKISSSVQVQEEKEKKKMKKVFTIIRNSPTIQVGIKRAATTADEIPKINQPQRLYCILSKSDKQEILNFFEVNGASKTLEIYGEKWPSLTKKKLNLWRKSASKFLASPGKRSHDPQRDVEILDWIKEFEVNMKRNPNRREMKEIALETSHDPSFKASKGWLDKFCKKHQINLMPMKGICKVKKEEEISTLEFSTLQSSMEDETESFVLENGNSYKNNDMSFIDYNNESGSEKGDYDEIPFFRKYQW